jgi:hypothetical protein
MTDPYPLSEAENDIFERYALEFGIAEKRVFVKTDIETAAGLGGAAVGLFAAAGYLGRFENHIAEISKWPLLYTGALGTGLGGLAIAAAAKDYLHYRRDKKIADSQDY